VQLSLGAADRLVELLEERVAPLPVEEAASVLFAARSMPAALAHELVGDAVRGDGRLRLAGGALTLARPRPDPPLEYAEIVVFDLETTGLSAASSRICEIGAVRMRGVEVVGSFQTLVDPGTPLPDAISRLTGLRDRDLRRAPAVSTAVRRFTAFAGNAALAAHNARFDASFLERQLDRVYGRRLADAPLDTVALARQLLAGRVRRTSLAALVEFFGTPTEPCHRALPDALATAEVLGRLIGLAQERGARRLSDLHTLAAPRRRRVYGKRSLAHGAPARPGVYRFVDGHGRVLYVGRARDLRARLRSYFRSDRQRPSVEAALGVVERIEWDVLGSELEAALEELRLIRELDPPANARGRRAHSACYLRRRGDAIVVSSAPTRFGPLGSRRQAALAVRALEIAGVRELESLLLPESAQALGGGPLPALRRRLRDLSDCLRYEEAARLRDRIAAVEAVSGRLVRLERLRSRELCLLAPAVEPGCVRAFFVAAGRVCAVRTLVPGGAALEVEAGLAAARAARAEGVPYDAAAADALLALEPFLRRPPPELRVAPLDAAAIRRAASSLGAVAAAA
jgi:DNA polymerase-3 subunit epsilon